MSTPVELKISSRRWWVKYIQNPSASYIPRSYWAIIEELDDGFSEIFFFNGASVDVYKHKKYSHWCPVIDSIRCSSTAIARDILISNGYWGLGKEENWCLENKLNKPTGVFVDARDQPKKQSFLTNQDA